MLRFLVVLDQAVNVDIGQFQSVFAGTHLVVTRESSQSLQLLCQQNPDVIVSIGEISFGSFLWKLPYWRRMRWINLPDRRHSADSIWQAGLSLFAGTCDESLPVDELQIATVCLSQDPRDIASAYCAIFDAELYDNLSFLVQDKFFDEVVSLLSQSPALGSIMRVPDCSPPTPFSQMLNAACNSKAHYLWPIHRGSMSLDNDHFKSAVEKLKDKKPNGLIVGNNVEIKNIPNEILQPQDISISQLFLSSEQILKCNRFGQDFPLESMSRIVLNLLKSTSVEFVNLNSLMDQSPADWWSEDDQHLNALLTANVRYIQHIQTH